MCVCAVCMSAVFLDDVGFTRAGVTGGGVWPCVGAGN